MFDWVLNKPLECIDIKEKTWKTSQNVGSTLLEKCPYSEFFRSVFSGHFFRSGSRK